MECDTGPLFDFDSTSTILWDPECWRPLINSACKNGDLAVLQQLMEEQPDLSLFDPKHWTPYHVYQRALDIAIQNKRLDVAEYLIGTGCQITENVAHSAVSAGSTEILEWLLDHGWLIECHREQTQYSPIRCAISRDSIPLVKWLLDHGVSPNIPPRRWFRETILCCAVQRASLDLIQMLVSYGADVTKGNVASAAVLSRRADREPVLRYLLEEGAPTDRLDRKQKRSYIGYHSMSRRARKTPLHAAVENGKWELAKVLVEFGGEWDKEDSKGVTPRDIAREKDQEYLILDIDRKLVRGLSRVVVKSRL